MSDVSDVDAPARADLWWWSCDDSGGHAMTVRSTATLTGLRLPSQVCGYPHRSTATLTGLRLRSQQRAGADVQTSAVLQS